MQRYSTLLHAVPSVDSGEGMNLAIPLPHHIPTSPYFRKATTGSSQKYRMTDRRRKGEGALVTKRTSIPVWRQLNR